MILSAFTLFHVALSLAAIGLGFVVLYGLLTAQRFEGWNALFLWTTVGMLAIIRKRIFLNVSRCGFDGSANLEAKVVEVAVR